MGSFGENLRREREMRGISLDEIAASTRIAIRFFQAMEADDFASLPGGIFTRSFIRSYAKYLGLDEEQVIAEYQLTAQPKDLELSRLMFASSSNSPRPERRSWLLPGLLAAAMLAGGYALFRYAHRSEEAPSISPSTGLGEKTGPETSPPAPAETSAAGSSSAPAPSSAGSAPASNPASAGQDPSQKQSPSADRQSQPAATPAAPPAGPTTSEDMVLQVAATERVWVSVDADGKTALQRTLDPQDIRTIKAKDHFDLLTGNAQGLILTLNGETLKPVGREGEVRKVHLTRSDVKPGSP
jgi:cytoskeleton protein RodZ